ncbi:MAG TPA: MauE/DoxX family redox-associated membrane protein [Acidimicrobiales bacterium]|nr:MauE/DoxX family redox-associated membrane protein [Acidimicrobiales bacterium]
MDPLHVPLVAGAVLLVPAGVTKLVRPSGAYRAMRLAGVASHVGLVRILGAVELTVAFGVISSAAWAWSAALGALYAGFGAFVVLALWRHAPIASCGCFGAADPPPTAAHAGVDAALSAVGLLAAIDGVRAPLDVVRDGGTHAVIIAAGGAAVAAAVYALFRFGGSRAARSRPRPS